MALGLSAREVEVLGLVAAGLSNGEIADRLFITRKTASVHVTHILDKLGVDNRVGAAMVAARVGLIGRRGAGRFRSGAVGLSVPGGVRGQITRPRKTSE